jgi:hypothetical protein
MKLGELELDTPGSILGEPNTSETNGRLFDSFQGGHWKSLFLICFKE